MTFFTAIQTLRRSILIVSCFAFLLPGLLSAQMLDVQVQSVEGKTISGRLTSITPEGELLGLDAPVKLDSVLSLRTKRDRAPVKYPVRLHLVGGGILGAQSIQIVDEAATLIGGSGPAKVPLEAIRGLVWKTNSVVENALANPSKDNDQVLVTIKGNQGSVEGLLEGVAEDGVKILYQGKSRRIALEKVDGVVIADLGSPVAKGARATIEMIDGSTLVGVIAGMDSGSIKISLTSGVAIEAACNQVYAIVIASDRLQYLSDLAPVQAREDSDFAVKRSYKKDASVTGRKMSILGADGETMSLNRGLGVQATSELTYSNGGFDRLRAIVGIDLETKGRGDCEAIVRGDGIELWRKRIQGGQRAETVDIDISGINQVTLTVNPGREFDLADHLNWGNVRFLKTKQ